MGSALLVDPLRSLSVDSGSWAISWTRMCSRPPGGFLASSDLSRMLRDVGVQFREVPAVPEAVRLNR